MTSDWYVSPYGISESEATRRKDETVDFELAPPVPTNRNSAKLLENVDFRNFLAQKYYEKDAGEIDLGGLTDTSCVAPSPALWDKPKTQTEKDFDEYQKYLGVQDNYMKTFGKVNPIHASLAIDLKSAGNDYSNSMAKVSKMKNVNEAKTYAKIQEEKYNQRRKQILLDHNMTEDELNRYESSFVRPWGLTQEVLYDIPGVIAKQGLITIGTTAIGSFVGAVAGRVGGTAAGAVAGSEVPVVGTVAGAAAAGTAGQASGAAAGAKTGYHLGKSKLGFALAVMWDTYDKEKGWYIADEIRQNPNMTDSEFKMMKLTGGIVGLTNAAIEGASDAFAYVPVLKNITSGLPLKKITSKHIKEAINTVAKNSIKKETIKSIFESAVVEGGEEAIQGRVNDLMNNWVTYYGVCEKNEELDRFPDILQKGNIDLMDRPQAKMPDGSIATVRSMAFTTEKGVILLPSVKHDGKVLTNPKDVWRYYQMTGEFLGKFKNEEDANKYANLVHEQQARLLNYVAGSEMLSGAATDFAGGAQPSLLMGGALSAIRRSAKRHAKQVANYNEKVETENIKNGFTDPKEQEVDIGKPVDKEGQLVLEGKVTEEINLAEQTTEQLDKSEAESQIRLNELDKDISTAETKLANAEALGLSEQEKADIQKDLDFSKQQREEVSDYRRSLGTEKAIRQAEEETSRELDKVNGQLEKAGTALEAAQSKKETATGKALQNINKTIDKLNNKIQNVLEPKQQKLMSDLNKLQTRTDIESVLQGKKTTIASTALVKSEKKTERDIMKAQEALNKQTKKTVEAKFNGVVKALKSFYQGQAQGFKQGIDAQKKETKEVRRQFKKMLRESGIKQKEMSAFDSIAKNIITANDLSKAKDKIKTKVEEILEERNKEAGRRIIERLRKRVRLYKKNPVKGKFTAGVQEVLNRVFGFTQKTAFEAGLDLQDILSRYPEIMEDVGSRKLTEEQKQAILKITTGKDISDLQQQRNDLEEQSRQDKKKWEGRNENREDVITDVESAVESYEYKKELQEADKPAADFIKNLIKKSLNFLNMGIRPNDLKVMVEESALRDIKLSDKGELKPFNCKLYIRSESKYTIPHEIGHYLDRKIGEIFGITEENINKGEYFSNSEIFERLGNRAKAIKEKFDRIVQSEINRFKKNNFLNKNISLPSQQYFLSPKEIFAKVFEATYYKSNNINVDAPVNPTVDEADSYFVKFIPDQTIDDMISLLNDIAQYQAYGKQLDELDLQIEELEKKLEKYENEKIGTLTPEELARLPKDMAQLAYEIEIAHDIENRSSADMARFIEYVSNLIEIGKDLKQAKMEAERAETKSLVDKAISFMKEHASEKGKGGKAKYNLGRGAYSAILGNFQSLINAFLGSELAEKFDMTNPDIDKTAFVDTEKEKLTNDIVKSVGAKNETEMLKYQKDWLSKTINITRYTANNTTTAVLNHLDCLCGWLWAQSELGRKRLEHMFQDGVNDILDVVENDEKLKALGQTLLKYAGQYYDAENKIFREDNGVDMPIRSNYFPFIADTTKDMAEDALQSIFNGGSKGAMAGLPSFTHSVVESSGIDLKLMNPIGIMYNHIDSVGEYVCRYPKLKQIMKVLSNKDFRLVFRNAYGDKAANDFQNILKMYSPSNRISARLACLNWVNNINSNWVVAQLALKASITVKQLLSFTNYMINMPVADFWKYQLQLMRNPKDIMYVWENSEYIRNRFKSSATIMEMVNEIESIGEARLRKWQNFLTFNVRFGDVGAIMLGGYSMIKYLESTGVSTAEAIKQFENATAKTQQFSSDMSLSPLQLWAKNIPVLRPFMNFSNTPFQYARLLGDSIIVAGRGEMSKKDLTKVVIVVGFIQPLLYNMATSFNPIKLLLSGGDDDDAKKDLLVNDLGSIWVNNLGFIPAVQNWLSDIHRTATGQKVYQGNYQWKQALSLLNECVKAIEEQDINEIEMDDLLSTLGWVIEGKTSIPMKFLSNTKEAAIDISEGDYLEGFLKLYGLSRKKAKSTAKSAR